MYDSQRNEQFQTLQKRLAETETRLAASSGTPSFSEQQQQDIDRLLMQSKHKVEEAEQEKMKVKSKCPVYFCVVKQILKGKFRFFFSQD